MLGSEEPPAPLPRPHRCHSALRPPFGTETFQRRRPLGDSVGAARGRGSAAQGRWDLVRCGMARPRRWPAEEVQCGGVATSCASGSELKKLVVVKIFFIIPEIQHGGGRGEIKSLTPSAVWA
ncbi:uncharacterized protein LOC144376311 isoform X2 [Ictidomys tridecemlineatus]